MYICKYIYVHIFAYPSAKPEAPLPATVVTWRVYKSTRRILLLLRSVTSNLVPSDVNASPRGEKNRACVPTPSTSPVVCVCVCV